MVSSSDGLSLPLGGSGCSREGLLGPIGPSNDELVEGTGCFIDGLPAGLVCSSDRLPSSAELPTESRPSSTATGRGQRVMLLRWMLPTTLKKAVAPGRHTRG